MHYLSNGEYSVPMVVRASCGSGLGFGSQHSQTLENWVAATPGLKVVQPSDAQSAYSLLRASIQDNNPVMFLEPRILYAERGEVDTSLKIEIGKARILQEGNEATVVSLGNMVNVAREAIKESGLSVELIDLATLVPWDRQTVLSSVKKTGRLIVVEESPWSGGWGSEIVSYVVSHGFSALKSAPFRITAPDVPVPYNGILEARYVPTTTNVALAIKEAVTENRVPQPWWIAEGVSK